MEMCFHPNDFESVRLEFHAAKLFCGQDIKGKGKTYDDLKRTYQIVILGSDKFFVRRKVPFDSKKAKGADPNGFVLFRIEPSGNTYHHWREATGYGCYSHIGKTSLGKVYAYLPVRENHGLSFLS